VPQPLLVNRLDTAASFAVPSTSEAWEAYFAEPNAEAGDATVETELLQAVREAVGDLVDVRGAPASVGRGASALGSAISVLLTVGGVGAGLTTLAQSARITRTTYRLLRRRLKHRPNVSLAAATFLAAADLIDRLGHENFSLLGSGDTATEPPDTSFTGDDTFWVVFLAAPRLHAYLVAANGRAHYLGVHEMHAGWGSRLGYMPNQDGQVARAENEDDDGDSYEGL